MQIEDSVGEYLLRRENHTGAAFHVQAALELEPRTADALLLYTDNRVTGEYVQLSLVGGAVRLRFNWGGGRAGMIEAGKDLNLLTEKNGGEN